MLHTIQSKPPNETKFFIRPNELKLNDKEEILSILFIKNIRLELHCFDTNEDKPALVLIHGNSSSKNAFLAQIEYFSNKYRIIAIDLLGHGESSKISDFPTLNPHQQQILCETFYAPEMMIATIKQLLESKKIENAHFIGWSLGGHIVYGIANENTNLVASVITIGSPPVLFSKTGFIKGFSQWFVNTLIKDWVQNPKRYNQIEAIEIRTRVGFKNNDEYFIDDLKVSDPQMRKNLFLNLNEYDDPKYIGSVLDGENFVKKTNIPICLMVGEDDSGINSRYINSFQSQLKNKLSEVKIVKQAPHAVFNSNPEEFYKIVDNFLEKITR